MADNIINLEITKQVAVGLIRQAIVGVGMLLVKKGIIDAQTADAWTTEIATVIFGLLLIGFSIGWKWLNAKFNILTLIEAVKTDPPADTKAEVKAAIADVKAAVKKENTVAPL